jgi:alpha-ketoglutarate-dependent taurine dioxygenase
MIAQAELTEGGRRVRVTWPDGKSRELAARWLFDHADDARHAVSGQRGQGALALEGGCRVEAARIDGDELSARFSPSGLERRIRLGRLRDADASAGSAVSPWLTPGPIAATTPVPFDDYLRSDRALREVLSRVARFGLAVLAGAGRDPDVVERTVERFGFVRETNYGRTFDVRIEPQPGNLAYTDRALDLHTDNPYRDPVPTLQLLHAITMDGAGGETRFVDGFAHAEALRREEPEAFEILARTPVGFAFAEDSGARWSFTAPVLSLDARGDLQTVRMNHRSLDLAHQDCAEIETWYEAYLAFYRRVHAPEAAFGRRLEPGEVVIFDNRRILHGRGALTGDSPRWLRGCYADADGLMATLAGLDRSPVREAADAA